MHFLEIWGEETPKAVDVDVIQLRAQQSPARTGQTKEFLTLQSDLTKSEEELYSLIQKNYRYEIRRALGKEHYSIKRLDPVTQDLYSWFLDAHTKFAKKKGFSPLNKSIFDAYYTSNRLVISCICFPGDVVLSSHAFVTADRFLRYVAGMPVVEVGANGITNAVVGMANKALFWDDILYFKRHGYVVFDWGGIFQKPANSAEKIGINSFKKGFGGQPKLLYDNIVPFSNKGKVYVFMRKVLKK